MFTGPTTGVSLNSEGIRKIVKTYVPYPATLILALIVASLLLAFVGFVLGIVDVALVAKTSSGSSESNCTSACPRGPQGPPGINGTDGLPGLNGTDGTDGTNGLNGTCIVPCTNGTTGPQGPQGLPGFNGTMGVQGFNGSSGVCSQSCYRGNTTFAPFNQTLVVYVDKSGSDSSGNGDPTYPFLTVGMAISSIVTASAVTPFEIHVNPGVYVENTLQLKPFIFIVGIEAGATIIQAQNISLDPLWNTENAEGGMFNLEINNVTVTMNFVIYSSSSFTRALYFTNVWFDDGLIFNAKSNTDSINLQNCIISGGFATNSLELHGGINRISTSTINGANILLDDFNGGLYMTQHTFSSNVLGSTASIILKQTSAFRSLTILLLRTLSPNLINATGNSLMVVQFDVPSYPNGGIITVTGAVLTFINTAFGLGYVPTVSGNWSPLPVNTGKALDQLAANIGPIAYADSGTISGSISIGGGSPVSISMRFERFGKSVIATLQGGLSIISGGSVTNEAITSASIPSGFIPTTNQQAGLTNVLDTSTGAVFLNAPVFVTNSGTFYIWKDSGGDNFGTSATVIIGSVYISGLSWQLI